MPRATARMGVDPMLGSFLRNVVYATSLVIVALLAIDTLGVKITPLLAVLGTAGLAVGLALKDSLSNIASGVMLVTLRPFRVGDVVTVAGQTGNFQLNVTLPLIAVNLLDGIGLLANVSRLLADSAIAGLKVREDRVAEALARNPILVTALNPIIGYEKAAAIAKRAYKEQRPVLDVALEDSGLDEAELRRLLDPTALTAGGIQAGGGGAGG